MSLSDRRSFLGLLATLPAAACGFSPVYGPGGSAAGLTGRIAIVDPTNRNEFTLVNRLEDRLGRAGAGDFLLAFQLETNEVGLAISGANEIERYNLTGTLTYTLTDPRAGAGAGAGAGTVVASGEVSNFTSYSATASTVGTLAAEESAYDRLMVSLADLLVTRLLTTSANWAT